MRIQVLTLLALTGATAGALVGALVGLVWQLLPFPTATTTLALAVVAAVGVAEVIGRWRPLAVRRQVPQLWGRIFGPRTVAVLYGTRLGVGPATILPTWLWWGAIVLGAACGPWTGAAAGAVFAVTRTIVTHGAVAGAGTGEAMSQRISRLRAAERPVTIVVVAAVLALAVIGHRSDRGSAGASSCLTGGRITSTAPTTPEALAVDDLLLDDTLPGFRRDDAAVGAGLMDLEGAAAAESDSDAERALLETRGFVRGASRAWCTPDDDIVYLAAYDFATARGAAAYLTDGLERLDARGAARFPVPQVADAKGFTSVDGTGDEAFTAHAVVFTRDMRWFLVLVGSPSASRTTAEAIEVATALDRHLHQPPR